MLDVEVGTREENKNNHRKKKQGIKNKTHSSLYLFDNFVNKLLFATLETRGKLGRVNFREDFWDCYGDRANKLANI